MSNLKTWQFWFIQWGRIDNKGWSICFFDKYMYSTYNGFEILKNEF